MNLSRFPDDGPRDFQGARLTYNQVLQINELLEKVNSDYYSFSFVREMRDLANQTFQRAYRKSDRDKMEEIGPELQVLDHVLSVAFSGGYKKPHISPDPKHLQYLERLHQEATEVQELEEEIEQAAQKEQQSQLFEREEEEVDNFLQTLPAEILSDIDPLSDIPQIATNQNKIRRLIEELRVAMEDDEPLFIVKSIENKIAHTHEVLADQLSHQNLARRLYRYY